MAYTPRPWHPAISAGHFLTGSRDLFAPPVACAARSEPGWPYLPPSTDRERAIFLGSCAVPAVTEPICPDPRANGSMADLWRRRAAPRSICDRRQADGLLNALPVTPPQVRVILPRNRVREDLGARCPVEPFALAASSISARCRAMCTFREYGPAGRHPH